MSEVENIKISIITVTLNCREYVERTINSVANNTYHNLEYIVIDGCSTDGTLEIIEKYREKIDYFVSAKDGGISQAFNKGIAVANSDLTGIVNAGDILDADILAKIVTVYDGAIDVYRCNEWVLSNGNGGKRFLRTPTLQYSCLPVFFRACHMGCYIKTSILKENKYDENYRVAMDTELLYRLNRLGCYEKYINESVGGFLLGGVSSTNIKRRDKELLQLTKENGFNRAEIFFSFLFLWVKGIMRKIGIRSLVYKVKALLYQ